MSTNDDCKRRELIERLLGPAGYQLDCQECFELVNEYAELELVGIEAGPSFRACALTLRDVRLATRITRACVRSSPNSLRSASRWTSA